MQRSVFASSLKNKIFIFMKGVKLKKIMTLLFDPLVAIIYTVHLSSASDFKTSLQDFFF